MSLQYATSFRDNDIDLEVLKSGFVTDELLREVGVNVLEDRRKILKAIGELVASTTQAASIDASGTVTAVMDDKYVPLEAVQGQYEEFVYPLRYNSL